VLDASELYQAEWKRSHKRITAQFMEQRAQALQAAASDATRAQRDHARQRMDAGEIPGGQSLMSDYLASASGLFDLDLSCCALSSSISFRASCLNIVIYLYAPRRT
jgi:hypothetical protein